ncbi:hypothetical protein [Cecembia rubra]|uniref:hypothetical protein n=1 Tax=Cecembia rubra TaxID=1485585 RepID=UPI0027144C63|nr:hypothetical protein [Cecembia rubra]
MKTLRKIIGLSLLISLIFVMDGYGQGRGNVKNGHQKEYKHHQGKYKGKQQQAYRQQGPPPWAPAHGYRAKQHVYFPDYHVFYDARRSGYVYWNNGNWAFSASMPAFIANIDLGNARIQVMSDIPLNARPEIYYDDYFRNYPPRRGSANLNIHIPF